MTKSPPCIIHPKPPKNRFYLDAQYRQAVEAAWGAIPEKQRAYLTAFLARLGYHGGWVGWWVDVRVAVFCSCGWAHGWWLCGCVCVVVLCVFAPAV